MIRLAILSFSTGACLSLLPLSASAQSWALEGIDAVAYRHQGQAVPGRSDIATQWHGELWYFISEENRAAFEANPNAYAPGLDGLCAMALSEGRSEPGNPRYFVVIDQHTYLLRSAKARQRMLQDPQTILQQAKAVWARHKK